MVSTVIICSVFENLLTTGTYILNEAEVLSLSSDMKVNDAIVKFSKMDWRIILLASCTITEEQQNKLYHLRDNTSGKDSITTGITDLNMFQLHKIIFIHFRKDLSSGSHL